MSTLSIFCGCPAFLPFWTLKSLDVRPRPPFEPKKKRSYWNDDIFVHFGECLKFNFNEMISVRPFPMLMQVGFLGNQNWLQD